MWRPELFEEDCLAWREYCKCDDCGKTAKPLQIMQQQTPKSRRNLHVTIYLLIQRLFRSRLIYDCSVLRVLHSTFFWLNLDCFWPRCTKLKFASRIGTHTRPSSLR